jgi:sigma-E factor negative regulatory protein RseA
MSEQIREQVSAFLDGELPSSETELLLKRLTRDAELRESFGRYGLIGEAVRGAAQTHLTKGFSARVNRAIDGEPLVAVDAARPAGAARWWRPLAGAAVAAGVAAIAVVALQQRAGAPRLAAVPAATTAPANAAALATALPVVAKNHEALSYTVPATLAEAPTALPAARLTNYVFAHSKYSSFLDQRNVLSGLITEPDVEQAEPPRLDAPEMQRALNPEAAHAP